MKNIGLILAGGIGKRIHSDIPKQFIMINSKPLIIHTLSIFEDIKEIDELYVVCIDDYIDLFNHYIKEYDLKKKITIVPAGSTGFFSTLNGIKCIEKNYKGKNPNIVIHDSNRPFVKKQNILDLIDTCNIKGNAISAVQSTEILIFSEDGISSKKSYNREKMYRVLKPECYKLRDLISIYAEAMECNLTDVVATCDLLIKLNKPVFLSEANVDNIKITYNDDLNYAKKLLK